MQEEILVSNIDALVVFRNVRNSAVLQSLRSFMDCGGSTGEKVRKYTDFVSALFDCGYDLSQVMIDMASEDENPYVILRANNEPVPEVLQSCVGEELKILSEIAQLKAENLIGRTGYEGYLPKFDTSELDFRTEYEKRIENIHRTGYGIYARNTMFRIEDGIIVPVSSPDRTRIADLIGYERERQQLLDNTTALLEEKPAANTLLYGDAGTGKSSTVKAVVNDLAESGLRLVEVRKDQLRQIPHIMEELRDNPLKFILFVDDLSFTKDDDNFSSLKAILEGSASVRASNTVIYATSNRRHLVKESFSDREGDEIHRNDTIQELVSLSGRFGLTILFSQPTRDLYLEIVHEMARSKGITMDEKQLDIQAQAFATRKGGRSPRAAEQFTDSLVVAGSE